MRTVARAPALPSDSEDVVSRSSRKPLAIALAVGLGLLAAPATASAFGTVDSLGQHAEHEKITRALSCEAVGAPNPCFQPRSLDELAGRKGTFGAVGAPDRLGEVTADGAAHCDAADDLPGFPYPATGASRAQLALRECIDEFEEHLDQALDAAGDLIDGNGRVVANQVRIVSVPTAAIGEDTTCTFPRIAARGAGESAKCRVYNGLGRALHAAEDFWSHSNWADQANPELPTILAPGTRQESGAGWRTKAVIPPNDVDPVYSFTNPAGLHRAEVVPFLRYPVARDTIPTADQIQAGTAPISGCDDSVEELTKVVDPVCVGRVGHSHLNKDKGLIDWRTGATRDPSTTRGKIADNFDAAVTGARAQARAVWGDFAARVTDRYGDRRGGTILTAITTDSSWTSCRLAGSTPRAFYPPVGSGSANRSANPRLINRTGRALECDVASLASGEWAEMAPDSIGNGRDESFRVESNMSSPRWAGGPEGHVIYRIADTPYSVRVSFDNPIIGSNTFRCAIQRNGGNDTSAPYRCTVERTGGDHAYPRVTVTPR